MPVSGKSYCLFFVLGLALVPSLLRAQGVITSVTGASPVGPVNAITENSSSLPYGFTLTLNGTFNPSQVLEVHWVNGDSNTTFSSDGQLLSVTATQITLTIPAYLFTGSATTQQTIGIYEVESGVPPSNTATFYINPPMTAGTWSLPAGAVGTPYTSPVVENGGTGPYTTSVSSGYTAPPGLSVSNTTLKLTGTPTLANSFYYFPTTITDAWGNTATAFLNMTVYPMPVINPPLVPSAVPAGSPTTTVTINGQGFVAPISSEAVLPGSGVILTQGNSTVDLPSTVVSGTQIQATISSSFLATPGTSTIQVIQPNGTRSNAVPFVVSGPVITSLSPSSAAAGTAGFTLTVTGANFLNPSFLLSALRPRLSGAVPRIAAAPQVIFGSTPLTTTFVSSTTLTAAVPGNLLGTPGTVPVTVVNPGGQTSNPVNFSIITSIPPLEISGNPAQGTVGVPYSAGFGASGGKPGYQFSTAGGTVPPGLTLSSSGNLTGTPTQAGQFHFVVQVTDSAGSSTSSAFLITIVPPPLVLSGSLGDTTVGTPVNVTFTASGGVPPYSFSASGALPSGTSFSNGTITGTANSTGTFTFTISVTDSAGTPASKTFTVKVTIAPLAVSGSLGDGQVNVPYSAQLGASGGTGPYSFTATGLPPGVSLSGTGAASGTPSAAGTYTVSVTVADHAGAKATQTFTVNIAPAPLTVTTASLPDGALQTAYSASLSASGGVQPYSWSFSGLPDGVSGATNGTLSGTPTATGTFQVTASVADSKGGKASKSFTVVITTAPLSITSSSLPGGVVGTAVSGSVSAAGGVPPYQFSASGLPAGVTLSSGGTLSGTPTSPGTASVSVTVTDSKGATASKTLSMVVALPSSPGINFTGLPGTANPASQPTVTINLGNKFPVDVLAVLTMTFSPDSGADDPAVQFSTGGRTTQVTIPAGATVSPSSIGVQTGTVAGVITITAHLTAAGQDITGTPIPTITIRVNATAPVISTVTATRNSTGFTVTVTGFASARDITQAVFQFTAAAGTTLSSSSVTVPVDTIFNGWYQSSASAPFGSQFTYTQPFNVSGGAQSIVSVSVTLAGKSGTSNAVSANLQ